MAILIKSRISHIAQEPITTTIGIVTAVLSIGKMTNWFGIGGLFGQMNRSKATRVATKMLGDRGITVSESDIEENLKTVSQTEGRNLVASGWIKIGDTKTDFLKTMVHCLNIQKVVEIFVNKEARKCESKGMTIAVDDKGGGNISVSCVPKTTGEILPGYASTTGVAETESKSKWIVIVGSAIIGLIVIFLAKRDYEKGV